MEGGTNLSKMVSCSGFMFKQFSVIATWGMGVGAGGQPKKSTALHPRALRACYSFGAASPVSTSCHRGRCEALIWIQHQHLHFQYHIRKKCVGIYCEKRHWYRYQRVLSTKHKGFWYNLNGTGSKVFTHPMWPLHLREILWQSWLSFT